MMSTVSRRLLLNYTKGSSFSFRHFLATATDTQLLDIATRLNNFQSERADKYLLERVFEF